MAYGWHLEAKYADGYVHSEKKHDDQSPYVSTANIFNDILEKRPEATHGKLERFSLISPKGRYDVDFRGLPNNARPIYYRKMQAEFNSVTGPGQPQMLEQHIGFQYTDLTGKNHQEVVKVD